MENQINNLNLPFQPTFTSTIPIHSTYGDGLFSNIVVLSNGSFQTINQAPFSVIPSNYHKFVPILPSYLNPYAYKNYEYVNAHTVDSMPTTAKCDVMSSQRVRISDNLLPTPNEASTNDRCHIIQNIRENIKAVPYNELSQQLSDTTVDNQYTGPINFSTISVVNNKKKVQKPKAIKEKWRQEEDESLDRLFKLHGEKKWSKIALSIPGRSGKQCRERWLYHVNVKIKTGDWTEEEDRVLVEGHKKYSNRWVEIAKQLPGRTDNSIKNRLNNVVRRVDPRTKSSKKTRLEKYSKFLIEYAKTLLANDTAASTSNEAEALTPNVSSDNDLMMPDDAVGANDELAQYIEALLDDVSSEDDMQVDENCNDAAGSTSNAGEELTGNASSDYDLLPDEFVFTDDTVEFADALLDCISSGQLNCQDMQ